MQLLHIFLVTLFAVGIGSGQLLFKYASTRQLVTADAPLWDRLISLCTDWSFLLGASLYMALTVYWIWLLTFIPLSRAYPWTMILSLAVVTTGGVLFFQESVSLQFLAGMAVIAAGLVIMST